MNWLVCTVDWPLVICRDHIWFGYLLDLGIFWGSGVGKSTLRSQDNTTLGHQQISNIDDFKIIHMKLKHFDVGIWCNKSPSSLDPFFFYSIRLVLIKIVAQIWKKKVLLMGWQVWTRKLSKSRVPGWHSWSRRPDPNVSTEIYAAKNGRTAGFTKCGCRFSPPPFWSRRMESWSTCFFWAWAHTTGCSTWHQEMAMKCKQK